MVDARGNEFRSEYDVRGRKTLNVDPGSGSQTLAYDAFDQVIRQVDGDTNVSNYAYDVLGRPIRITTRDGTALYGWDTAPRGIGQLSWAQSADGVTTSFTYDALGRPSSSHWSIAGRTFDLGTTYDEYSRVRGIIYPRIGSAEPLAAFHRYTARGDLQSVEDAWTGALFWRAQGRNALSQITSERFGNGLVTERRYGLYGHPLSITTIGVGAALQDVAYVSEPRLSERRDVVAGTVESFQYDPFDRLARRTLRTASGGAVMQDASYSYDTIGNLTGRTVHAGPEQSLTLTYGGPGAGPHAVTSSTIGTYTYDAKGNQRSAPGRDVTYTAFDLPRRMTGGGLTVDLQYDAFFNRAVERRSDGTEVISVGGIYERRSIAGQVTHALSIAAAGRTVAQVSILEQGTNQTQTTAYLHDDALGSTEMVTDASGAVLERRRYGPFGAREGLPQSNTLSPNQVRPGFTGASADVFGLINMKGRIFDPAVGRFLTPDPFVSPTFGGEGFNRYTYAFNNPFRSTDPTGFQSVEEPSQNDPVQVGVDENGNTHIVFGEGEPFTPRAPVTVPVATSGAGMAAPTGSGTFGGDQVGLRPQGGVVGITEGFYDNVGAGPTKTGASNSAQTPASLWQQLWTDFEKANNRLITKYSVEQLKSAFTGGGTFWERRERLGNAVADSPMLTVLPFLLGRGGAATPKGAAGGRSASALPDTAFVCRGGTCTAGRFANGTGVTLDSAGKLQGVSVNSAAGATLEELAAGIPNKQVGVTTVGQIRSAGGDVIPSPTPGNPVHCTMCGISPQQAEILFTPTVRNPNIP